MLKRVLKSLAYWIVTGLCHSLQIFTFLPYRWQMHLGRYLGLAMYYISRKSRHVATTNIQLCFPDLTTTEQDTLIKKCFASVGMGLFEALLSAYAPKRLLKKLTGHITGLEAVQQTLQSGQGAIILFPHLIPMYLIGHLALHAADVPFSLMYHAPKNKAINDFFLHHLNQHCPKIFNRRDVGSMIKYLRDGNLVWYAPDLDIGRKQSIFAPFFNVPAATLTATLRIAKMSQAKVFPIQFYRRDNLSGYDIDILPALENFPSDNSLADLTRVNQIIEQSVKQKPEQYLWIYKRFSTRPSGEAKLY